MSRQSLQQNIQWSADYYRKKKYYKIFSDQLTITERRNITEYTRTGKKISDKPTKTERNITEPTITRFKFLVTRRLLQKKKNHYSIDNHRTKMFSDGPSITEMRNITDSTNHRKKFNTSQLLIK